MAFRVFSMRFFTYPFNSDWKASGSSRIVSVDMASISLVSVCSKPILPIGLDYVHSRFYGIPDLRSLLCIESVV